MAIVYVENCSRFAQKLSFYSSFNVIDNNGAVYTYDSIGTVTINGVLGVIYTYGTSKYLISVRSNKTTWDNAVSWCSNLGAEWHLPYLSDLQYVYKIKTAINEMFTKLNVNLLSDEYWTCQTSTSFTDSAVPFNFTNGAGSTNSLSSKKNSKNVRAIRYL